MHDFTGFLTHEVLHKYEKLVRHNSQTGRHTATSVLSAVIIHALGGNGTQKPCISWAKHLARLTSIGKIY